MEPYAHVVPYWPDVVRHYLHQLVDLLGWTSLTGLPLVLALKAWKRKSPGS
jgi:hypothetical protein